MPLACTAGATTSVPKLRSIRAEIAASKEPVGALPTPPPALFAGPKGPADATPKAPAGAAPKVPARWCDATLLFLPSTTSRSMCAETAAPKPPAAEPSKPKPTAGAVPKPLAGAKPPAEGCSATAACKNRCTEGSCLPTAGAVVAPKPPAKTAAAPTPPNSLVTPAPKARAAGAVPKPSVGDTVPRKLKPPAAR